ncbi:ion channel [Pontiella sulfatireligans]|uniref:Potassium channel domain-containing protein n=1 Tax=Pontiella sulfatireligans TaxID=2750658 RepID=A0A6C2UP98_9BACT|nr:ion channel [Pontiella sulfatireligans]VGO21144.1 hypothetical protein SCARR_03215 [Pontiella sulfatireligans]
MKTETSILIQGFLKGRFSIMLLVFAALFLVLPVLPQGWIARTTSDVINIAVVISCLRAISVSRIYFSVMVLFTALIVLIESTAIVKHIEGGGFETFMLSFKLVYLLLIFISIMRHVLDRSPVTVDKVCGALSAYFLMGFTWAVGFTLFHHINPASFNVPIEGPETWATYFSFTTLATLGYGDITPQTVPARAYAIMEAVTGQIFLAVIVARLIALQILHKVAGDA